MRQPDFISSKRPENERSSKYWFAEMLTEVSPNTKLLPLMDLGGKLAFELWQDEKTGQIRPKLFNAEVQKAYNKFRGIK